MKGIVFWLKICIMVHRTTGQIARETGIYHSSFVRIIRDELRLKCIKKCHAQELTEASCIIRLSRAKKLLLSKFLESAVDFIFLQMRRYLQLHHLSTSRTTVFTPCVGRRSATVPPTVCVALGRCSASLSWCLSRCQNLDALTWSL